MGEQDRCKLDFVVERYDLDDSILQYESVDNRLRTRWKGADGSEPDGYRTLTEWFNKSLLRTVYDTHGRDTTGARVDTDYEALVGDDEILKQEVSDHLAADGINADQLRSNMISWSTMRSHLNKCLNSNKDPATSDTDWELNSVQVAKGITEDKASQAISSVISKGDVETTAPVNISVQVLVSCQECPTRLPLSAAIDRGFVCNDH